MGHRATTVSVKYKGPEQYMLCLMSNLNPAEVRRCRCLLLSLKVGGLSQKSEDIFAAKRSGCFHAVPGTYITHVFLII
jgi:hypothetical protein